MRYIKFLLLPVVVFFLLTQIYAQKTVKKGGDIDTVSEKEKTDERIIILPFYDYTDSSMKYLSTYIPELIKARLTLAEGIEIYGPKMIRDEVESRKLSPRRGPVDMM